MRVKLSILFLILNTINFTQALSSDPYNLIEHQFEKAASYSAGKFNYKVDGNELYTTPKQPTQSVPQKVLIYKGHDFETFTQEVPGIFEKVLKRVVPGKDGREQIQDTMNWPYPIHVSLAITCSKGEYGGSGIVVGPHHILTAGHCVYDKQTKWAQRIDIIPALNNEYAPFGKIQVTSAYVFPSWINNYDTNFDMALLLLESSIGYQTGWAGLLSLPDKKLNYENVTITGYPGDKGFKQMWSMTHKINQASAEQFYYEIDTYGGQSGSGVWINKWDSPYVLGVHTNAQRFYGYYHINSGVRLSEPKFKSIVQIIADTFNINEQKYGSSVNKISNSNRRNSNNVDSSDSQSEDDTPRYTLKTRNSGNKKSNTNKDYSDNESYDEDDSSPTSKPHLISPYYKKSDTKGVKAVTTFTYDDSGKVINISSTLPPHLIDPYSNRSSNTCRYNNNENDLSSQLDQSLHIKSSKVQNSKSGRTQGIYVNPTQYVYSEEAEDFNKYSQAQMESVSNKPEDYLGAALADMQLHQFDSAKSFYTNICNKSEKYSLKKISKIKFSKDKKIQKATLANDEDFHKYAMGALVVKDSNACLALAKYYRSQERSEDGAKYFENLAKIYKKKK